MDLNIDHLRGWIGREQTDEDILTPRLVRQFAATFDRDFPETPGAEAPTLIHFCLAQPAAPTAGLGADGHPERGGFLPPVPLPRRMWAGGALTFHAPLRVGAPVTRRSTISDVTVKDGRSGTLCFVTVGHEVTSDGEAVLSERQDIVYRNATPAVAGAAAATPLPAAEGPHRQMVTPTAALLFRYSALTFNGHRIHYDAPYAREVEGYRGLIVHGPMQATQLCQYAADIEGSAPARFRFRSLSPIFDTTPYALNAEPAENGLRLWTAAAGGPVAMEAFAEWN